MEKTKDLPPRRNQGPRSQYNSLSPIGIAGFDGAGVESFMAAFDLLCASWDCQPIELMLCMALYADKSSLLDHGIGKNVSWSWHDNFLDILMYIRIHFDPLMLTKNNIGLVFRQSLQKVKLRSR